MLPSARSRRLALALLAVAAGCRLGQEGQEQTVRGVLTEVEARSIARLDSVTLRTADGRQLRFRVAESVEETPSHLRQHMTFGEPVTVTYRATTEGLVATRITD